MELQRFIGERVKDRCRLLLGEDLYFRRDNLRNYNVNVPVMKGISECAEMFGISQRYCRELAKTGAVRVVRVGRGKILVNVQSMADYFNQTTIPEDESPNQGGIQPIPVRL